MNGVPEDRLDSMLQGLARAAEPERPRHARGPATPGRDWARIRDIVTWSTLTNVVLLAVFLAGWNLGQLRQALAPRAAATAAAPAKTADPLAISRQERADNELLTRGPQRQLKGPLQVTWVASSAAVEEGAGSSGAASPEQDQGDGGEVTMGPEDPAAALSRSPVLRRGRQAGEVEIGSFTTVSLSGADNGCLETAYGLLEDAGAPRSRLQVLAESAAITVARVCASNGSLVVTCRMGQVTISPRRPKPNEACSG